MIKTWNATKGFGFVSPSHGGKDVFIHISDFENKAPPPKAGQMVNYTLSKDTKGRVCGVCIRRKSDKSQQHATQKYAQASNRRLTTPVYASIGFLLVTFLSAYLDFSSRELPWVYLVMSLITYGMYLFDKSAAIQDRWRTKENSLHFVSLLGGWPGAVLAQFSLRHKTKKASFRRVFWLTVVLNIAVYAWLHSNTGREHLDHWQPLDQWLPSTEATIEWSK